MRIEKKEKKEEKKGEILEIQNDVRIPGTDFILEKGDKIEVFSKKEVKEEKEKENPEKEDE